MDSSIKLLDEYVGIFFLDGLALDRAGDGHITVLQNGHLLPGPGEGCHLMRTMLLHP